MRIVMKSPFLKIIALLFSLISIAASAQEKVVEDSGKKPKWLGGSVSETIIVSASAPELMEAQNKCMDMVKQEIINSVAVNISSSSASSRSQTSFNEHYAVKSEYSSKVKTIAANLPFVTGISITNAETFWEKVYVKNEKRYFYRYHLKYPYPRSVMQNLVFEFKRLDAEKEKELDIIKEKSNLIESVEDIGSLLLETKALSEYFFDDTRKTEVALLQKKLNDMYSHIFVQEIENIPGVYSYMILLDEKPLRLSKMPRFKSDYATYKSSGLSDIDYLYTVTYGYRGCVPEDPNTVELTFSFGNRAYKHKFSFDLNGETSDIKFPGVIDITLKTDSTGNISFSVGIDILAGIGNKFQIEELSLTLNELENPLKCNAGEMLIVEGKSRYDFDGAVDNIMTEKKGILTDGYIKVKNLKNGKMYSIKIQRPYKLSVY